MVCKEDVVTWFKESSSYKRIDLMCSLLNMCIPFELRFLGTCVEDLGKRDFHDLREAENRANSLTVLTELRSVSDKRTRRNVAIYLSLLHSSNHGCSNELYRILSSFDCSEINNVSAESDLDDHPLDELLLLYTMAINHPAFTYEQKRIFEDILLKLQEEENKVCLTNNVLILVKSPLQEMDPAMLTCGANQNAYVRPYITPIAAIPVACAPDRKGNPTHETDNGSHASITRNGPTASPQPMFLTCVRPTGYPMQHTRQLHLEESSLPVTVNCRSVPSPAISPTHSAHPLDDSTVQIPCANSSTPPPPPTSSPTVVSARGPRRRPQSSSPGVGDPAEHEMAPRVSRGHRGGGNSQRRPATSPRRHNVRGRGGIEQREIKEIPRYGAQLGDADEGPEESSTVDSDATDSQQNADQSDAQHITNCLVPSVLAPPLPLSDAAPKVNDAAHLNNSSPPTPQLEEAPLPKGRLCPLEEGGNSNLIENRPLPQQPHVGEARPEVSPDEEVTVQSMQWVRAAPGTATGMPPRQPCLPHARPAMQRAAFSGGVTNCSSAGGRGDHGMAPVPSSPSSAFSSSSSLSSSSSSSSSGVSPQPPPPVPPTSSVPYTPPSVPPPYLPPPHLMAPPPHTLRFSTTFTTGYLPTSGGSGVGNNGGGGPAPPTPVGTAGSYLTPRHSFAFAPNGLAPTEIMYAATAPPPPQYHAGHHPRVGGAPGPVMDHSGQAIITQPGYPQYIPTVLLTSRAKGNTCYNCGGRTHRGGECRELTMEEITRPGYQGRRAQAGFRLIYFTQKPC
ncbi:flocculation protein FLO11 isoform X2 [Ischnura elegans]|uniref:flocculation protein FLO11 isoform X2 n=1 Tax=Ischnura elegans TaxID=197161 RepID=UPI001ED886E8|nr:flocculation protein FLO11 isoform X2 [Ischnura elegans]